MAERVLAIFPEMDTSAVERFRSRWDPLAVAVPAHITVAFPFEWTGPLSCLVTAVQPVLAACAPFALKLSALTVWQAEYLFLILDEGREQVRWLHESIYGQALDGRRPPAHFVPHMTVGRCAEKAALQAGISEAAAINLPLTGRALSLTVYRRDGNGGRVREADLPLGRPS